MVSGSMVRISRASTTRSARLPASRLPVCLVLLHGVGIDGIGVDRGLLRNALIEIERKLPLPAGSRDRDLKGTERIIGGDVPVAAGDGGRGGAVEGGGRRGTAVRPWPGECCHG